MKTKSKERTPDAYWREIGRDIPTLLTDAELEKRMHLYRMEAIAARVNARHSKRPHR